MALPKPALEFHDLGELAQHSLDASSGNWEDARKLMEQLLLNDNGLYERFCLPLIRKAIEQWIVGHSLSVRDQMWIPPEPDRAKQDKGLEAMACRSLLEWPLAGGLPLGDATKDQLLEHSAINLKKAATYACRGRWYALIARKLKNKRQKVGEVLDHDGLRKLQVQAEQS